MQEYINQLGGNLKFIKLEVSDISMLLYVDSTVLACQCPACGVMSRNRNSSYYKTVNDLPLNNKLVELKIKNRVFKYENKDCDKSYFSERLDFVSLGAHKTYRLLEYIENNMLNVSSMQASKIMKKNGIKVGKSTICNLKKKNLK